MKKAYIETYGCTANRALYEKILGFLEMNNWEITSSPEEADLIVVNSCGVKENTEEKIIHRLGVLESKKKKKTKVVVTGCLPRIAPQRLKKWESFGPFETHKLGGIINANRNFSEALKVNSLENISIIKIASGCLGKCSFCATKLATGWLKSRKKEDVLREFRRDLEKGYKEFWLTSQDNFVYGFDLGYSLVELLEEMLKEKKDFKIRVGMGNPKCLGSFLDRYLGLFEDKRLYRFFHIPVQSGSNNMLEKMRRGYKRDEFE